MATESINPGQPPLGRNVLEWGSNKLNVILVFCFLNWYEWHVLVLPFSLEEVYRRASLTIIAMLKSMQVIWR